MQPDRFNISRLKGKLGQMRDLLLKYRLPYKLIFIIMGIASTVWFLIRVIPKPSRATYPCMRVAAPFMSGFVTYLLAIGGLTVLSRRLKWKVINVRFGASLLLLTAVVAAIAIVPPEVKDSLFQTTETRTGPEDGPNKPFGDPKGLSPGRVVWVWNPDATNEKFQHNDPDKGDFFVNPENNNGQVQGKMFRDGVLKLSGKKTVAKAWEAMFRYFNEKKHGKAKGYSKGEKIFIKINQG